MREAPQKVVQPPIPHMSESQRTLSLQRPVATSSLPTAPHITYWIQRDLRTFNLAHMYKQSVHKYFYSLFSIT